MSRVKNVVRTYYSDLISNTASLARRSVVKIMHTGSCGITSGGSDAKAWVDGSAPADCRISNFIQLPGNSDSITAMAIDGADNLWVRPIQVHGLCLKRERQRMQHNSRLLLPPLFDIPYKTLKPNK